MADRIKVRCPRCGTLCDFPHYSEQTRARTSMTCDCDFSAHAQTWEEMQPYIGSEDLMQRRALRDKGIGILDLADHLTDSSTPTTTVTTADLMEIVQRAYSHGPISLFESASAELERRIKGDK